MTLPLRPRPPVALPPQGQGQGQRGDRPPRQGRPDRPERPRRRRLTAAERHRRTFFAKLTELRKQEQAALEADEAPPADDYSTVAEGEAGTEEQPVAEGAAVEEQPQAAAPQQPQAPQAPATSPTRSARAQARLAAAIERVGGPEAVLEALQPKRRDDGETMKWSSVCAEQAQGVKPGDPTFTAWVRLAATPVRDVKAIVNPRPVYENRGRGGRGRGGGQAVARRRRRIAAAAAVAADAAATTAAEAAPAAATSSSTAATARSAPACASSASSSSRTPCVSSPRRPRTAKGPGPSGFRRGAPRGAAGVKGGASRALRGRRGAARRRGRRGAARGGAGRRGRRGAARGGQDERGPRARRAAGANRRLSCSAEFGFCSAERFGQHAGPMTRVARPARRAVARCRSVATRASTFPAYRSETRRSRAYSSARTVPRPPRPWYQSESGPPVAGTAGGAGPHCWRSRPRPDGSSAPTRRRDHTRGALDAAAAVCSP